MSAGERGKGRRTLAVLLSLGFATGAGAGEIPASRQAELTSLVRQDCGSCHGMTLKGGLGRPLLPDDLAGKSAEALAAVVLDGIPGTPMPPWRGLLSDDEALWIVKRLAGGLDR
ncbi:cytochrome c [Azospirillum sp. YIM B02556]|uniref:Cytochrome c n=2 Tax=Azospirillum endophyticum TaxID=2800326 RepID=A0ABS1FAD5_9PROT|nr:cytochrome c [Azospirillum endophyticum]MBK1840391.1 cytochrome c [Azospirillum endophyticum]